MLTLLILAFLAYSFYTGARRGLALQSVYTLGYAGAALLAWLLACTFKPILALWVPYPSATLDSKMVFFGSDVVLNLDNAFYYGVAFFCLLLVGWLIVRLVVLAVKNLEFVEFRDRTVNWLGAGMMNMVCAYVVVFFALYILALVPVNGIQQLLGNSHVAVMMIRYTPIASQAVANWWINA